MGHPAQVSAMSFEAVDELLFQFFLGHRHIPSLLSVIGVTVR